MDICQEHWDKLIQRIADVGIGHLVAETAEQTLAQAVNEAEGRGAENIFDPLFACNNIIVSNALRVMGFDAINGECPICSLQAEDWIDSSVSAALEHAKAEGLLLYTA